MATNNDELRGALFANKDKQRGDSARRPDFKGFVQVNGVRYRASAWTRTGRKSGQQFLSLTLELPQAPAPGSVSVNFPITLTPEQAEEQARIDRLAEPAPAAQQAAPDPTDLDAIARLLAGGS